MSSSSSPFAQESGTLGAPALVVHGGAGTFERLRQEGGRVRLEEGLAAALTAGWAVFEAGGGALSAAVEAVASLEDSGLFNAGRGSSATSEGRIETDASVMDGATSAAGAIGAATWPANPVKAALLVAKQALDERSGALTGPTVNTWHPVFLAGAGADQLAAEGGLASMATVAREAGGKEAGGKEAGGPAPGAAALAQEHDNPGTVGAVALDSNGHLAAATSTGGLEGKPPGRVGDSAIVGAGTWADDAAVAVSATGVGEAFILAGFAHRVDWLTRSGADLSDALAAALHEVSRRNGSGGAIALVPSGRFVAMWGTRAMARGWRSTTETVVRV
jgi:L-asparaginase / beta-aspartyl-peptidase